MSTRDELEAALRARPDEGTLAVYADLLQAQGDPRGELIALDVGGVFDINRRRQLLTAWLGDDVELVWNAERGLWHLGDLEASYATFELGLVDLVITEDMPGVATRLLASAGSDYLRRLSVTGPTALVGPMLAQLAERRRPWLQHLVIARPRETPVLVRPGLCEALVAATPNLEVLDLGGRNLFESFAHPNVRELGLLGAEAIDLVTGPPMPAVHAIDFAFEGERPTPPGLVSPARFPALRRMSFERVEPGTRAFAQLGTLGARQQLTHLVLPALRTRQHVAFVQAAIDRMPRLREVTVARAYACHGALAAELRHPRVNLPVSRPWRPRDELIFGDLVIDGHLTEIGNLVTVLEDQYDELPEELQAIWHRFFQVLHELENAYARYHEQAFAAADLARALDALALDHRLQLLRDHLHDRLAHRPQFLAALHLTNA